MANKSVCSSDIDVCAVLDSNEEEEEEEEEDDDDSFVVACFLFLLLFVRAGTQSQPVTVPTGSWGWPFVGGTTKT